MPRLRVWPFSCGRLRFDPAVFVPERPRGSKEEGPIPFYLVEHPGGRVLIDTGCHPEVADDAEAAWGGLTRAFYPIVGPGDLAPAQLRAAGFDPAEVPIVVCTHLHMDHSGGNSLFPESRFLVHEDEWQAVQDPALEGKGYFRKDWDHPLDYVTVRDGHDVFGDGSIRLLFLPGHSAGHMGVVLQGAAEHPLLLAVDAAPMRENLEGALSRNAWDGALFARSTEVLRDYRDRGAEVLFGHDAQAWAELPPGPLEL